MSDTGHRLRPAGSVPPPRRHTARYPTPAQAVAAAERLVLRHPGRCRLREVGRSRAGRPLTLLSVDRGEQAVLAVGGPHPNEPVGVAAALRTAGRVLEHDPRPGVSWHLLLCLDPDGAALNEGWLKGPLTLERHYRHFFRPAFEEQPELLPPPGSGREPMPESLAVLGLIDELRPVLHCSLHGVDFGGAFVQLTRPVSGLAGPFARSAAAAGIPLDVDSFDALGWASPAPGTYVMPGAGGGREALPDRPEDSTWSYAGRYGGVTAVLEAPMWAVDEVADGRPHPAVGPAVEEAAALLLRRGRTLAELLPDVPRHARAAYGPLLRSAEFILGVCPALAEEMAADWREQPLSVARVTTARIGAERIPLRVAAMLLRLLADAGGPAADAARARAGAVVEECLAGLRRLGVRWVPVDAQVGHQTRAALAAADRVLR
ncbi:M14 family zinc carboxypeptidase [Kitasatospora sp. NPDC004240]